eukprot:TRINITY_DN36344_c0_g1_i1.p1 TRINITY_DN36344_c0_g1~~TRINITY_DN36344_c0_g1_i1.p1  ORF type:complete len:247 (+),score=49.70 TRINITY_DN36344_c0_g1_i1:73-813(+)
MATADVAAHVEEAPPVGYSTSSIHNFDQRAPVVELRHPRLPGGALRWEQRGATCQGFVGSTSSVAWPTAQAMTNHLCEHPDLVRGCSAVLELGAGLGIVGAVCASLGCARVVLTDSECALPLLERNRELLADQGVDVEVARLEWGSQEDHAQLLTGATAQGFDLIVASDVILAGFDTEKLLASCLALAPRKAGLRILLGFEFREDWETIGNFLEGLEKAGFEVEHQNFEDEENDLYLYSFHWKNAA